jgi:hypothetical protein
MFHYQAARPLFVAILILLFGRNIRVTIRIIRIAFNCASLYSGRLLCKQSRLSDHERHNCSLLFHCRPLCVHKCQLIRATVRSLSLATSGLIHFRLGSLSFLFIPTPSLFDISASFSLFIHSLFSRLIRSFADLHPLLNSPPPSFFLFFLQVIIRRKSSSSSFILLQFNCQSYKSPALITSIAIFTLSSPTNAICTILNLTLSRSLSDLKSN